MKKDIPLAKVYEAYTAVFDKRIRKIDEYTYLVSSSDYSKKYTVKIKDSTYSSNDNATYWQHYASYPIIAVLILQNKVFYSPSSAKYLSKINWKAINAKFRNKYNLAIDYVLKDFDKEIKNMIIESINHTYNDLNSLNIEVKGNREKIILN